jgi:hypothetical protein
MAYPQGYQPLPPQHIKRKLSNGAIIAIAISGALVLMCGICSFVALVTRDRAPAGANLQPAAATPSKNQPTRATATKIAAAPTTSPTSNMLTVPDGLVGGNALIVENTLKELGFTNIKFGTNDPYDSFVILPQNWRVTKVEPGAGTTMRSDQPIVVTCTKLQ